MQTRFNMKSTLAGLTAAASSLVAAQPAVPIFGLVEPSGTGATSGSNFDNGKQVISGIVPPVGRK